MKREKITYQEMILKLKNHTHTAPNNWDSMASDLEIASQVSSLNTYSPPTDLWDKIEETLPQEVETKTIKPSMYKRIIPLAAASILILCIPYLLDLSEDNNVSYSSSVEVGAREVSTGDEGVYDLNQAYDYIDQNEFMYSADKRAAYEKELQQLEEDKNEILAMQKQYGADKNSQKIIAKIERKKASLIKSMIIGA